MLNYSVIISVFFLFSCAQKSNPEKGFTLSGNTQGTTYTIIIAEDTINFQQEEITNLLAEFDTVLSSYIPVSEISRLDPYHFFKECYELSQEVYKNSNGLFDPSVYSLVKDWGFFDKNGHVPSDKAIDSILQFTGFENQKYHTVLFDADSVRFLKKDTRFQLDFNAIAQGYSVDVLANFIEKRGHRNYYIEIGGELRLKGKNREGENWKIGIDIPDELPDREIISTLSVSNCGLATSGNYRNYFDRKTNSNGCLISNCET
jgi:thiamine biosynthesis lipoprotein